MTSTRKRKDAAVVTAWTRRAGVGWIGEVDGDFAILEQDGNDLTQVSAIQPPDGLFRFRGRRYSRA